MQGIFNAMKCVHIQLNGMKLKQAMFISTNMRSFQFQYFVMQYDCSPRVAEYWSETWTESCCSYTKIFKEMVAE